MAVNKSYRELEKDLNKILDRVENGEYEQLEDLLSDYEKGTKLIEQMQKKLDNAKNSIKKIN